LAALAMLFLCVPALAPAVASASSAGVFSEPLSEAASRLVPAVKACEPHNIRPGVSGTVPAAGLPEGGNRVRIKGQGFFWEEGCGIILGAKKVLFGSREATGITSLSPSELQVVAPAGTGTVAVTVFTALESVDAVPYTYEEEPEITAVAPGSGPITGGTTVTITGTSLAAASAVQFVGEQIANAESFKVESAQKIVAVAPPGEGTVCVTVTTPIGTSHEDGGCEFAYLAPKPTVTQLEPSTGTTLGGATVKITGTGFTGATAVTFGGKAAKGFKVESETSIAAVSPTGAAGKVNVTVTTGSGTSAAVPGDEFTYFLAAPVFSTSGKEVGLSHTPLLVEGRLTIDNPALVEVKCTVLLSGEAWNQVVNGETRGVGEETGLSTSGCTDPGLTVYEPDGKKAVQEYSVFVTAEEPLEEEHVEAEVCASLGPPSQCSEKYRAKLIAAVRRRESSLPWKVELARGEREGESVVLQRTGLHALGETAAADDAQSQTGTCYPKEGSTPASWTSVPKGCLLITVVVPQLPLEYVLYGSQELEWHDGSKNGLFPSNLLFEEGGGLFLSGGEAGEETTVAGEPKVLGTTSLELVTVK
jgi:hypothetical protein